MRRDKNKAITLRRLGKSYKEIEQILNIPKSTLSYWFRKIKWSKMVTKQLTIAAREDARKRMILITNQTRQKRKKLYKDKRELAKKQFNQFKNDKLFIAGLMIYWGEGDSKLENGAIRVANSDPMLLKLFNVFFKKYLPDIWSSMKAYLILYPDLAENECKTFWSEKIGLSLNKFMRSHYIKGRHPTKRLQHGVCTVTVSNRADKEIICTWIQLIKSEIKTMRV